ncbi:uncharacterized protein H6S33_010984 [Morchella sextelata]|uniref:uncharacterized protein n=1 Tax=Morchella sextelata TaxID=1174677 RepID=UPI001D0394CB|nr:uncharacterized protein H6S33_010984 [Morchella sextelata]KAH0611719.1 hypothetical protein H6S33_010984 [Morchella sextelata]
MVKGDGFGCIVTSLEEFIFRVWECSIDVCLWSRIVAGADTGRWFEEKEMRRSLQMPKLFSLPVKHIVKEVCLIVYVPKVFAGADAGRCFEERMMQKICNFLVIINFQNSGHF